MPLQTTETPAEQAEHLDQSIGTVTVIKEGSVWMIKRKPELFKAKYPNGYIIKLEGHMKSPGIDGGQDHTGASPTPFEKDLGFMTDMMLKVCTTFPRIHVVAGAMRTHFLTDMNAYNAANPTAKPFQLKIGENFQDFDEREGAFYIMPLLAGLVTLDGTELLQNNAATEKSIGSYLLQRSEVGLQTLGEALDAVAHPAAFNELGRIFAADLFNHNIDRISIGVRGELKFGPNTAVDTWGPVKIANGGNFFTMPQPGSKTGKRTFCGIDFCYPNPSMGGHSNPITDTWLGHALQEGQKARLDHVMESFFATFKLAVDNVRQLQFGAYDDVAYKAQQAADLEQWKRDKAASEAKGEPVKKRVLPPPNMKGVTIAADPSKQLSPKLYDDFRKGVKAGRHAIEKFVKETLKANSPNMPAQLRARAQALGWSK